MSNELIEILELSNSEIDNLARRILIIDDNPDIHRDYKSILASEDSDSLLGDLEKELFGDSDTMAVQKDAYYMDFASQGQEGLSKVQEAVSQDRSFMVAFVDMRMPPGWDGLETIEHIWQVDPEIQVVICTAYSDYSWTEMIQRLGKTDKLVVLKKPFDAVEVAQLANALTQKWILHRQATLKMDELDAIVAERTRELEKINSDLHQEMEERKQAEAALRQSERRFSDISYSMADWIWEVDTNGNYTFCSGKVKKILGYEPDELIGKTPFDLMPDKEAERMKATFARITGEKAAIEDLENWNLTQNGSEVCFLTNGIPILDENGELLGYRGVDKDITNRKQQEQELQRTMSELEQSNQALQETLAKVERAHDLVQLRSVQLEAVNDEYKEAQVQLFAANASLKESEELYRMLADNVADVIWTKDMNLHNTYVSPSIIRITGYTVEEFMQMTIDQAYPPTSVELINETFHEELAIEASCDASPTRQRVLVLEQYRKDGSTFWIEDKLAFLRDPEGAPIGIMGITRDITERRNAEEEIERNYQEQAVLSSLLSLSLEGTSLDEIIDLSLGEVFSIPWLGIEPRGCVFLVEGNELVMVSEQNMNPYVVKSCDRIEFGHCLCGRAARSGETIFKDCIDHEHETRFEGVMPHGHYCLPIQSMHGTLGVLNLYIKHGHKRDSREEQFLASVAAVIAGTIERKRADEALRESEEKYRLITENVDSLIAMVDCEGKYVYTNTAHQRVTGYEPKELIGKSSSDYVHPEDAKRLAAFSAAGDTGLVSYTYRLRCTDGSYKWMEGRGKLIYDETGKLHRAFTIANDITERLRAEETIRDSEEKFRTISAAANDAIVMIDNEGNISFWNEAANRILGYSQDDVLGKNLRSLLIPERYRGAHKEAFPDFRETGQQVMAVGKTVDIEVTMKDGSEIPVELSLSSFKMRDQWHWVGIMRDITERKQSQKILLEAKESAETASHAKSDFLASMSHEIRTPMNAILGMADLLVETPLNTEQQQYVHTFQSAGENLLGLINDVLDISKIEAGHVDLEIIDFNLDDIMEQLCQVMAVRAHQKGIELGYYINRGVPIGLKGDPTRLRQIVTNLIGNAIKFTDQGGVFIEIRKANPESGDLDQSKVALICTVSDTGVGIPADKLETIFEVFSQADASTTRQHGGTGLGLTISRQLTELMGGRIWVESEEGKSSTFFVELTFETMAEQPEKQTHCKSLNLNGVKILVIDDTATNRLIFNKILTEQGAIISEANDGYQGFAELKNAHETQEPYQLVLLDCCMPGMDGFQFVEKVNAELSIEGTIIMMLTSDNRSGNVGRSRELGIAAYLVKPIQRQHLLDSIANAMGHTETVEKPQGESPKTDSSQSETLPDLRILLVEDNADNRLLILSFLKKTPYKIETAENGKVAVEMFKSSEYNLVLMDVQMPVMDGYTATGQIRQWEKEQSRESTPIIALTAHATTEDERRSFDAGCDGHLTKPIKKAKLMDSILEYAKVPESRSNK